ncbi:MAG TPA: hypothetical protein VME47_02870 [Acetobacteraceae bacterium]|nr:hypothetical protein [Acetobacteraceae bacterium]
MPRWQCKRGDVPFGAKFTEKLTALLAATAICCGTAATHGIGTLAVVETLLGAAWMGHFLWRRHARQADAILLRCTAAVSRDVDALLEGKLRDDPDSAVELENAVAAITDIVPRIVPRGRELIEAGLTQAQAVAFYLDRAAKVQPDVFGVDSAPCSLFSDVVEHAWRRVLRDPDMRDDLASRSSCADGPRRRARSPASSARRS